MSDKSIKDIEYDLTLFIEDKRDIPTKELYVKCLSFLSKKYGSANETHYRYIMQNFYARRPELKIA